MDKKLVLLEFNELCPDLLNKWIDSGDLPNFKLLRDKSKCSITLADAEPPALEPWIQWYSLHTGLAYSEHKVFSLTDGQMQTHTDIWEKLNAKGLKTFNCGSMNAKAMNKENHIYLPDPWCVKQPASPFKYNVFHQFVSSQVITQSEKKSFTTLLKEGFGFLKFMLGNGLTFQTTKKAISQILLEKLSSKDSYFKRVAILDWLQTDLFINVLKQEKPDFSTFFLNSTAHLQHSYWKYLEPDKFNVDKTSKAYQNYQDAVLFGYKNMDAILARLLPLEKQGFTLVLLTALSQQAFQSEKKEQVFYKFNDVGKFISKLGFGFESVLPVMTHQYIYKSDGSCTGQEFFDFIMQIKLSTGEQVFDARIRDDGTVYFGTILRREIGTTETFVMPNNPIDNELFAKTMFQIHESKSGMHHPEGVCWWMSEERHNLNGEKMPIISIPAKVESFFALS